MPSVDIVCPSALRTIDSPNESINSDLIGGIKSPINGAIMTDTINFINSGLYSCQLFPYGFLNYRDMFLSDSLDPVVPPYNSLPSYLYD